MTYKLRFHKLALAEWRKLDSTVREPFKKKLAQRLEYPRVPSILSVQSWVAKKTATQPNWIPTP